MTMTKILQDCVLYIVLILGILLYTNVFGQTNNPVGRRRRRQFFWRMTSGVTILFIFGVLYQMGLLNRIVSLVAIVATGLLLLLVVRVSKRQAEISSDEQSQ
jgi:hypothetical protein